MSSPLSGPQTDYLVDVRAVELFVQHAGRAGIALAEHRLDDVIGDSFAIVGTPAHRDAIARAAADIAAATGVPVQAIVLADAASEANAGVLAVRDDIGALASWLGAHGTAIIRPDHYLFGTAHDGDGIADLAHKLAGSIRQ